MIGESCFFTCIIHWCVNEDQWCVRWCHHWCVRWCNHWSIIDVHWYTFAKLRNLNVWPMAPCAPYFLPVSKRYNWSHFLFQKSDMRRHVQWESTLMFFTFVDASMICLLMSWFKSSCRQSLIHIDDVASKIENNERWFLRVISTDTNMCLTPELLLLM